jgi:hypothetical protein
VTMRNVDWPAWLATVVTLENTDGTRGADQGIVVYNCPLCGDTRARGWANVLRRSAGCFNAGCEAEPYLSGGLYTLVQRMEQLPDRETAVRWVRDRYLLPPGVEPSAAGGSFTRPVPPAYLDWARWPPRYALLLDAHLRSLAARPYVNFAWRQWGLTALDLVGAGAAFGARGRYAHRLLWPIPGADGAPIGFQARTIRADGQPKYRTHHAGAFDDPDAEAGRPVGAMVYGMDRLARLPYGATLVIVEGIADVLRLRTDPSFDAGEPVALMGTELTRERAALLAAVRPARVVVALDADATVRAAALALELGAWGLGDVVLGRWEGGKDAGSGARLVVGPVRGARGLLEDVVWTKLHGRL